MSECQCGFDFNVMILKEEEAVELWREEGGRGWAGGEFI